MLTPAATGRLPMEPLADPLAGLLESDRFAASMTPWQHAPRLLLAVSGGPDSVALMGLAAAWLHDTGSREGRPALAVATVDHRLRRESAAEAETVSRAAARLGLCHATLPWCGPLPTTRLQERARTGRYALLVAHAHAIGATHLATAHTLDDQVETLLFRLARGSGASGLAGMQPAVWRAGIVHIRPLLDVRKSRLVATCHARGWPFIEDPSNGDPRFARTRWRRVTAMLEAEGLAPERFATLAARLRRLETAAAHAANIAHAAALPTRQDDRIVLRGRTLAAEPEEVFLRVLTMGLREVAGHEPPRPLRLQALERLCGGLQSAIQNGTPYRGTVAGGLIVAGPDGTITLMRETPRRAMRSKAAHQAPPAAL